MVAARATGAGGGQGLDQAAGTLLEPVPDRFPSLPHQTEQVGYRLDERDRSLVKALAAARARRTGGDHDDVPDPIGGPAEAHAKAGEMVAGALLPLLGAIAATAPGHGPDDTPLGAPQP